MPAALLIAAGMTFAPLFRPSPASAAPPALSAEALDALIAQLKTQQEQITANQTKIETQTAALKEEVRLAKIYASRGGGDSHGQR